jgi:hypothetical protein
MRVQKKEWIKLKKGIKKLDRLKVLNHFFKVFFLTTSCLLISFSSAKDPLEEIIAGFQRYISEHPQEKVYLHTDRQTYAAGETIWLKAYLTAGPFHIPSSLSSTIYVELIASDGEIIQQHKLFTPDGFTSGHLELSDSVRSGNYLLRAYTNWMRNSGEEFFFHRPLKIWNSQVITEPSSTIPETEFGTEKLDIQFFPEGGNLVQGILSKVAFKVIGEDGLGKTVKGKILEGDAVITEFESNSLGMGVFPLLPKKGKIYRAQVEGSEIDLDLPIAQESGLVMSVSNSSQSEDIVVKIQSTEKCHISKINLLAQTRGLVCASSRADLANRVVFVRIPKKEFPTGIAQITTLDENGNPLAERLVFIDHQDQLLLSAVPDKSNYAPREPIRIDINAKDKDGKPVEANFSMSVFDKSQVPFDEDQETIQSNLLLSSELRGQIENPGYYFNPENPDREVALDYLLLTQGWRKYRIQEALNGDLPKPTYRIEKGITITGQLTDPKTNKPIASGTASYLSLFPISESRTTASDSQGNFEFKDLIYFNSAEVMLQGKSKTGKSAATISADLTARTPTLKHAISPLKAPPSAAEKDFLIESVKRKNINRAFDFDEDLFSLEGVEVTATKITDQYTGPKIYGGGSAKITVADNPALENLQHPLDLVKGRVAGVQVWGSGDTWSILIQGVSSINSSVEPLIMVDDIPVPIEGLSSIPVLEIESVSVWKGPDAAIFGSRGANGVLGFYTKRGKVQSTTPNQSDHPPVPSGYQIEKKFYSPKYEAKEPPQPRPDRRVTLFWAPDIQTDSSGKATVLFYNHDLESVLQGELEGISRKGEVGVVKFQIEAKSER